MTLDLNTLQCNLVELHNWASRYPQAPSDPKEPLFNDFVANKSATRLYQKCHWLGHFWRIYWWIQSLSLNRDPVPKQVEETVKKTIDAFKNFQNEAIRDNQLYIDALFDPEGREIYEADEARKLKWRIHNFYRAVHPFWHLRNQPLSQRALDALSCIYEQLPPKPFLLSQALVRLEGLTGTSLPIGAFFKLALGEHLGHLEELRIKHYLARLKKPGIRIPFRQAKPPQYIVKVRFFHRTLKEIVAVINSKAHPSKKMNASLARLEIGLSDRGFLLFEQEDPKYMAWREQLPGKRIAAGAKEVLVGKKIGTKKEGNDRHAVFELPGEPTLVLKTGVNEANLSIEHEMIKRAQYGIPMVNYLYWDSKQRFALVEKIVRTLKEISRHYVRMPGVLRILYPVRDAIEALKNLYATPDPLTPKVIGFNAKGQLRTFKRLSRIPYNGVNLEKFTHKCGLKDQELYVGLMLGTRMHAASQVEFYASVLENALEGSSFYLFWATLRHFEFNGDLRSQADKFAKTMLMHRKVCEQRLLNQYAIPDREKFDKVLNYCFKVYHREKCIGSFLPKTLADDVCAKAADVLKLQRL